MLLSGEDINMGSLCIPQGIADKGGTANKYTKFNLVDTHDAALTFSNAPTGKTGCVYMMATRSSVNHTIL